MSAIEPNIDVIVPVYNGRRLTEACIVSVHAARNAVAFELVVVDDASTDQGLRAWLAEQAQARRLTLLTNTENLGFTRSVNRGMRLHAARDVLLLNSDTIVYDGWLDRLHRAAYSKPNVATANPLTNASHISCYPFRRADGEVSFEIGDAQLDALAAEASSARTVEVHTTVGFCMYVRRAALDDVGLFDAEHFPFGYGEESDFCYRARKVGWRHVVTGDVFVRHWEGQSFGECKARLVSEMIPVFSRLHPDLGKMDHDFAQRDPVRPLREALDLARLKLMLAESQELVCVTPEHQPAIEIEKPVLVFDALAGTAAFTVPGVDTLLSLPRFALPREVAALNSALSRLGVATLVFRDAATAACFTDRLRGRPFDMGLAAAIAMSVG